ncbi:hypothetical protein KAJ27_05455 [bacterium]|nr:hypothetical protein [bacterium]
MVKSVMDYRERQIQRNIQIVVVSVVILLFIIGYMVSPDKYDVGNTVEDFTLSSIEGEKISLYEFKNTFLLIEFFRTDKVTYLRPPEKLYKKGRFNGVKPAREINQAQTAFTNTQLLDLMIKPDAKIVFLSINIGEDQETVREFVQKCKKPWFVLLDKDKKIYKKFFDDELPGYVILNKEREIVYRIGGWSGLTVGIICRVLKDKGISVKEPKTRR